MSGEASWAAALGLAWLSRYGLSPLLRLLPRVGAEAVWSASYDDLINWGVSIDTAKRFMERRQTFCRAEAGRRIEAAGLRFLPFASDSYPQCLNDLGYPPAGLFAKGPAEALGCAIGAPRVAIVGTRRSTRYGNQVATAMSAAFVEKDVVVVSGLALGVDGYAHRATLDLGGLTAAVLGCGPDVVYPARHRALFERVGREGVLLSEYPPGMRPARWTFPQRNRILAAFADAVLVVEGSMTSGALHTVRAALDLGRPVFAVPGPIVGDAHQGCNRLIYDGAIPAVDPVVTVEEFFFRTRIERTARGLLGRPQVTREEVGDGGRLTAGQELVLGALAAGARSVEDLIRACGTDAREAAVALTQLEIAGLVERVGAGFSIRAP